MSVACEWCGVALVQRQGWWSRAKSDEIQTGCEAAEDGFHEPAAQPRGAHDEGAVCLCVFDHRPPYLELERHRILPGYLGGTYDEDNIAWICGTTHQSAHEVLRMLMRSGLLTYRQVQVAQTRPVSRYAYDLAAEGYRRWLATQPPA